MFLNRPRPMPVALESSLNRLGHRIGRPPVAQVLAKAAAQMETKPSKKGTKKDR